MKTLLLATAMLAAPLFAQTAPPADPAAPMTMPADPAQSSATDPAAPPAADPAMTTPPAADSATPMADPAAAPATDPAMAAPTATTPAAPSTGVVFQQPATVDQAFPPPAPKAEYPWCSKTVTDGCKQRRNPK